MADQSGSADSAEGSFAANELQSYEKNEAYLFTADDRFWLLDGILFYVPTRANEEESFVDTLFNRSTPSAI